MPVGARECSRTYSRPSGDFEAPCEAFTSFEKGAEAMAPAGVSLWTLCPVEGADVARIERFPAVFQGAARARTQCNGSPGGHNPRANNNSTVRILDPDNRANQGLASKS